MDMLESNVLAKIQQHYEDLLRTANGKLSADVVHFLIILRSLPINLDTMADVNELRGCEGVLRLLHERLAELRETLQASDEDSAILAALTQKLDNISPIDGQVRCGSKLTKDLVLNGLLVTERMKELLSDIAIPSFQVFDGRIRFSILFNLAEHMFAFADFNTVPLPVCETDTPDFMSICESFLVIDALITSSRDKLVALQARVNSVARFGAGHEDAVFR
ncbi:hypothetical protein HDU87_000085 [Geranomyces variabilis]|uniref:Uncharacterized protein n=1 Tax=Geranomyces variabilis TaxID=109894 RepID=A0AAD5TUW0_9FUNG|nr:hypothetical protein HDU87_000085 [Geranomyces variabilis]